MNNTMIKVDFKTIVFQETDNENMFAGLYRGEAFSCWSFTKENESFAVCIGDIFIGTTDEFTLDSVIALVKKTLA